MYYDIVEGGIRIRELRTARNMTRQELADGIGVSVNALRKIERGTNGAKIDTLVSMAELFRVSLDYLVCGCESDAGLDGLLVGLTEPEKRFVRSMAIHAAENVVLLRS